MEYPNRKTTRLKDFDYSRSGAYFITLCVQDRKPLLSRIPVGDGSPEPVLLPFGEIVKEQISVLQDRYRSLSIDHYVIMPNHIHILLRLNCAGGASPSPTVSDIVCAFKSLTIKECKKVMPIDKLFQRSFYDHVIRDEFDYHVRWEYIERNPARWCEDSLYIRDSSSPLVGEGLAPPAK